ncbi:MAG: hypothetical protein AVDCRST_MAG72-1511 [uncultured Nocardioidaceae bacterium]|uniref:Uncharacterized protein n=1 Tax=uncultured Nocardioidaceae bacterium TaxID=253824 RepID=A0A6J4M7Y4_9ACTN|nr:MAG: hypothetical protein AVDCRST_MAG72-1511 [uncultured Nocardioidaceae bacterium]
MPSTTPTVIMPSWAADRPPKVCRKSTAWPRLPVITESLTSSRLFTPASLSRNSTLFAEMKDRAAVTAFLLRPVAR